MEKIDNSIYFNGNPLAVINASPNLINGADALILSIVVSVMSIILAVLLIVVIVYGVKK